MSPLPLTLIHLAAAPAHVRTRPVPRASVIRGEMLTRARR